MSSSYRILVDASLAALQTHPFSVSIAGDEVEHAKPHTQPYLLAAAALAIDPDRCLVLGDSATGDAAGCVTVLVPGGSSPARQQFGSYGGAWPSCQRPRWRGMGVIAEMDPKPARW